MGKLKDECAGKMMSKFVGLRTETFSYTIGATNGKKAKGLTKGVIGEEVAPK